MTDPLRIALAGPGAFGVKHLDAISAIDGAEVLCLIGRDWSKTRRVADEHGIPNATTNLDDALAMSDVDAVILCTPTHLHASQALMCLEAGKHVQVEIPLCDSLADGRAVVERQEATGLVAMCGHTRRFNPSHQWIHQRAEAGAFTIYQMDVQTYFHRRTNTNALGEPRSWTDHLLWHHAAHTVDLFQYQTQSTVVEANAVMGPLHYELGIAMDMSIQLRAQNGSICTLSLSFNNEGPFGTFFRYIGEEGTYIARYDDLVDGNENPIDTSSAASSTNGIELQDREFIEAIRGSREPNASARQVLPCYEVLGYLEDRLRNPVTIHEHAETGR